MKSIEDWDTPVFRRILRNNLNVTNEQLLIIGDKGCNGNSIARLLTEKYALAAEELGLGHEVFYKAITPCGGVDNHLAQVIKRLPDGSVILVNVSQKMGRMDDLLSFRAYCKQHGHRFTSSSNLSALGTGQIQYVLKAYQANYKDLVKRAEKVKALLDVAEEVTLTTPAGTDIRVGIQGMKSVINSGIYRNPGEGGNLPAGEVYLPPTLTGVNGTIVIDGSYRVREGSRRVQEPITLTVKNSNILKIEGGYEADRLRQTLTWATSLSPNAQCVKIGELGMGINDQAELVGCTVVDEKRLGTCHFAMGSNAWFGGPIKSRIHLDQVLMRPKFFVDGKRMSI